jgi:hypothetical protein
LFVLVAWSCNTLVGPAYFVYVATGRLRWTILSHLCIGFGALVLGSIGGLMWGGFGALAGVSLALAAGSGVVVIAFHRDYDLKLRELLPIESRTLILASVSSAVVVLWICAAVGVGERLMAVFVIAPLAQLLVVVLLGWSNPNRQRLFAMLHALLARMRSARA